MKQSIDLNCDVGEGIGNEAELLPFLSSCNIACGMHAGDDQTMEQVILLAMKHKVAIGAHPSFDDRDNFGRKEMNLPPDELYDLLLKQIVRLKKHVIRLGGQLSYVKPHGALYTMAAVSSEISQTIIQATHYVDRELHLMGLAGSEMQKASEGKIGFIAEGFADRKYASANSLRARSDGGLITEFKIIEKQLIQLLKKGVIETDQGLKPLQVQSLCLHGDTPGAVALITQIRSAIEAMGIDVKAS